MSLYSEIEDLKNKPKGKGIPEIEHNKEIVKIYVGEKGWKFWQEVLTGVVKKVCK